MIIIFEGTDHCGKTTIAKEFAKRNPDYQYFKVKQERIHIEKIDPQILKQSHLLQLNFFYELARQVKMNIVMDRFYPSEYVYGSLFRDIDEAKVLEYDKAFAGLGAKIIIVEKADDKLEDELWTNAQLVDIKKRFVHFAGVSNCPVLRLQTDDEDLEKQLKEITDFIHNDSN